MTQIRSTSQWMFWLYWLVAASAGFTLGALLAIPVGWGLGDLLMRAVSEGIGYFTAGAIFGVLIGAGFSAGQWLVLRAYGLQGSRWIAAGAIAGALGLGLAMALVLPGVRSSDTVPAPLSGAVMGSALGLSLGIGHWLAIRREWRSSAVWPIVSMVTLLLALAVAFPLGGEGRELLSMSVAGLLAAALSGLGMVWLLSQQEPVSAG